MCVNPETHCSRRSPNQIGSFFSAPPGKALGDPVGTFVGGHGARSAVMNEIGEQGKIDIIPYEEDKS